MHPLWEVLNLTSEFKYQGILWRSAEWPDDENGNIMVVHQEISIPTKFNPYCLVEPVGISMGLGKSHVCCCGRAKL